MYLKYAHTVQTYQLKRCSEIHTNTYHPLKSSVSIFARGRFKPVRFVEAAATAIEAWGISRRCQI